MQKTFLVIVTFAMLISMLGCSKDTAKSVETPKPTETTNQVTAAVTPTLIATANNPAKELTLSNEELKNMNIFFSNFFEASFDSYNGNTSDNKLIEFSVLHNKINYGKRFSYVQGSDGRTYEKIDGNYVADRIQRFFSKNITLKSTEYRTYRDGAFYSPAADGESYNRFAQVTTECFDNGDGTLSVLIAKYVCNDGVDI